MPKRNVALTERQEALIEALIRSGRYQNAGEILREGLRLVEVREAEEAAKLEALREAARSGIAAIERGESRAFTDMGELERYLDALIEVAIGEAGGT
jgi:antitoxin ParD1/3/4